MERLQLLLLPLALALMAAPTLAAGGAHAQRAAGGDPAAQCLGEYQLCPSGECTLFSCNETRCRPPQPYRCPLPSAAGKYSCATAETYGTACTGLKGTHLDWKLPVAARVAAIVAATNTTEQIAQLTNAAPAIERVGLPAYQWLNDDEHGVMSSGYTTSFPDGPTLGATFDKELLQAVGRVVGTEARGVHNNQTGSIRPTPTNGMGLTLCECITLCSALHNALHVSRAMPAPFRSVSCLKTC